MKLFRINDKTLYITGTVFLSSPCTQHVWIVLNSRNQVVIMMNWQISFDLNLFCVRFSFITYKGLCKFFIFVLYCNSDNNCLTISIDYKLVSQHIFAAVIRDIQIYKVR